MSQLFDSLRRDRDGQARLQASRTAHGDAVLATLGYGRRRSWPAIFTAVALVVGILGVLWSGWKFYDRSEPARPLPRTSASPTPRRQPPHPATPAIVPPPPPASSEGPTVTPPSERGGRPFATPVAAAMASRRVPPRLTPPAVTGSLPAIAGSSVGPPADELAAALEFQRTGDFENALQHYAAALRENEANAPAHNNLGLLYQEKRLFAESTRELQRALVIDPRNTAARNNLGVTFLMQAKLAEATAEFRAVLATAPRDVDALVNLGLAQRMAWQFDSAKETLMKALALAPRDAATHYNLGQLYDETHEPARAVEHYRTFLDTAGLKYGPRAAAVRARIAALSRTPE